MPQVYGNHQTIIATKKVILVTDNGEAATKSRRAS